MKHFKHVLAGISLLCSLSARQAEAQNYQWVKGSSSIDIIPRKTAMDKAGNSVITGQYKNMTDFNFSDAPADTAYLGPTPSGIGLSAFFAKYDAAGNFTWAKRIFNAPC